MKEKTTATAAAVGTAATGATAAAVALAAAKATATKATSSLRTARWETTATNFMACWPPSQALRGPTPPFETSPRAPPSAALGNKRAAQTQAVPLRAAKAVRVLMAKKEAAAALGTILKLCRRRPLRCPRRHFLRRTQPHAGAAPVESICLPPREQPRLLILYPCQQLRRCHRHHLATGRLRRLLQCLHQRMQRRLRNGQRSHRLIEVRMKTTSRVKAVAVIATVAAT